MNLFKNTFYVLLAFCLVNCGTEKETVDQEEKDTIIQPEYVGEETGTDPADLPCGLKGARDTFHTMYQGNDLRIVAMIDCPEEVQKPSDSIEEKYTNHLDRENITRIVLKGKKLDTSFFLMKKYFADSLGMEFLSQSVFGRTSFEEMSGKENFIFSTFIGRAYSDDGMVVKFSFNRKKGFRVLSTEYPEMGDAEMEE